MSDDAAAGNPWTDPVRTFPALGTDALATPAVENPPAGPLDDASATRSLGPPQDGPVAQAGIDVPVRGECATSSPTTYVSRFQRVAVDRVDDSPNKVLVGVTNIGSGPVHLAAARIDRATGDVRMWLSTEIVLRPGERRDRWVLPPPTELAIVWSWCREHDGPFAITVERPMA